MEPACVVYYVFVGLLVWWLLRALFSGGRSKRTTRPTYYNTNQVSNTRREGQQRMDSSSRQYVQDVRNLTRR